MEKSLQPPGLSCGEGPWHERTTKTAVKSATGKAPKRRPTTGFVLSVVTRILSKSTKNSSKFIIFCLSNLKKELLSRQQHAFPSDPQLRNCCRGSFPSVITFHWVDEPNAKELRSLCIVPPTVARDDDPAWLQNPETRQTCRPAEGIAARSDD